MLSALFGLIAFIAFLVVVNFAMIVFDRIINS